MDLQAAGADAKTALSILRFLKQQSSINSAIGKATKEVWTKWIAPNPIAHALLYHDGAFFDYIKRKSNFSHRADDEHTYGPRISSYKEFKENCIEGFDIMDALEGFVPCNVDAERLFSWGRLSKNHLQGQMSPANHSRDVFLNTSKHLVQQ